MTLNCHHIHRCNSVPASILLRVCRTNHLSLLPNRLLLILGQYPHVCSFDPRDFWINYVFPACPLNPWILKPKKAQITTHQQNLHGYLQLRLCSKIRCNAILVPADCRSSPSGCRTKAFWRASQSEILAGISSTEIRSSPSFFVEAKILNIFRTNPFPNF